MMMMIKKKEKEKETRVINIPIVGKKELFSFEGKFQYEKRNVDGTNSSRFRFGQTLFPRQNTK